MKRINILVVDDKQENLANAEKQFKDKNVDLICCNLFSVAAQILKEESIDILLTDLMLPGEAEGISDTNPEIGVEVPYGLVLSIIAKNAGISHVAIITDISHHSGPIAWAVDNILGKKSFVSGFNEYNKNWLRIAEGFVTIKNDLKSSDTSARTKNGKKIFMLMGKNDPYKKTLAKKLETDFNIILVKEEDMKNASSVFTKEKPDFVLLIGELNENAKGTDEHYQKPLYKTLVSTKKTAQKIIVAGFLESDYPEYLQLPFSIETLREKMVDMNN